MALVQQPQPTQAVNWVFTYNYGAAGQPSLEDATSFWDGLKTKCSYAVVGYETAPSSGQLHLQGFCQLKKRARITELKKLVGGLTVHWEVMRGTPEQNVNYCKGLSEGKTENLWEEVGEAPTSIDPGERERDRYKKARVHAANGDFNLIDDQIYICHLGNVRKIHEEAQAAPSNLEPGTRMWWFWGPPRSGKSREARDRLGDAATWYYKGANKWWDNYISGQPVLLDDLGLENGKVLVNHLKQWLDIYAFGAEVKGGRRYIRPSMIYITSNYHPWDIWGGSADYDPIMARLRVRYFSKCGELPPPRGPSVGGVITTMNVPHQLPEANGRNGSTAISGEVVPTSEVPVAQIVSVIDLADSDDESDETSVHSCGSGDLTGIGTDCGCGDGVCIAVPTIERQ